MERDAKLLGGFSGKVVRAPLTPNVLHFAIIIAIALFKTVICRIDTKYTKEVVSTKAVTFI